MAMKNDSKFEEDLTCHFKIDMRNFTNFDLSIQKSQKFYTLMAWFWPKYIMFEPKKYRGVMFDGTEDWHGLEGKLTCSFKNDMKNFSNFRSQDEK